MVVISASERVNLYKYIYMYIRKYCPPPPRQRTTSVTYCPDHYF